MGQGTADVKGMAGPGGDGAGADSPREAARRLDRDIDAVRDELSGLVTELNRRRHDALDVKLQLRSGTGSRSRWPPPASSRRRWRPHGSGPIGPAAATGSRPGRGACVRRCRG